MTGLEGARELRRRGRFTEAADACRAVLAEQPGDREAQHLLGRVLTAGNVPFPAVLLLQGLLVDAPGDAGLHASLARALVALGDHDEALAAARHAVELDPGGGRPQRAMAAVLRARGDDAEALEWLRRAVADHPAHPGAAAALAEALFAGGEEDAAAAELTRLAESDPDYAVRVTNVAFRLRVAGQEEAALAALRAAAAARPDDPELGYLARAGQGTAPERAPDAYVASHFDRFAATFDEQLSALGYAAPGAVAALAGELVAGDADVLDAGCGTGLCGPLLRPLARRLVGVDLSGAMVERARALEVYDEVHVAELGAWLDAHPEAYDLVVAADVLVYFGALEAPLARVASALRPGGHAVFTVERHDGDGVRQDASGRFAHAESAVRAAAGAAGLAVERCDALELRQEAGAPVLGLAVVLGR